MKRLASILLAMLLLLTACSSNGSSVKTSDISDTSGVAKSGLPIVSESITLKGLVNKYPDNPDWNSHPATVELEKRTNIHVEWICIPDSGFLEKRNLLFASNDLPDFVIRAFLTSDLEAKYSASKQIVTLDTLFNYAPNLSKLMKEDSSILKNIKSSDGHVYSLPQLNTTQGNLVNKYFINEKWLQKLNLSIPKTTDELYQTLKAFLDKDANGNGKKDELGFSGPYKSPNDMLANFYGSWGFGKNSGIIDGNMDIDDSGKIRLIAADAKFKDMLSFFNKLWKDGLLDKENFSQDIAKVVSKVTSDQVGFCSYGNNNQYLGKNRGDFVQPSALKGPNGDNYWVNINPFVQINGTFVITTANKNPQATMRWVDYLYSKEGTVLVRLGIEGKSYQKGGDGTYSLLEAIKHDPNGLTQDQALAKWALYSGGNMPQYATDKVDQSAAQLPETKAANATLQPNLISFDKIPRLHFSADESIRLSNYAQDIKSYINENVIKFITGQRDLSTYDQYVADLNKMNVKDYKDIYQLAYERWKKN